MMKGANRHMGMNAASGIGPILGRGFSTIAEVAAGDGVLMALEAAIALIMGVSAIAVVDPVRSWNAICGLFDMCLCCSRSGEDRRSCWYQCCC